MRKVELPLAKGRRRDSKNSSFNGKEGRDDFRKSLILKKFMMDTHIIIMAGGIGQPLLAYVNPRLLKAVH